MLSWFFVSPAERRLLGFARLGGPTPWVIAIMTFSIMLIAATGLALANTAGVLSRAIESRYALEVPGGGANLDALLAAVRSSPGVTSTEAVPESAMRKTLERWLGPAAQSAELPVPALINFDVLQGADVTAVQKRAQAIAPGARIMAHRDSVAPLLNSLDLLQAVAFGLVLLLSAVTELASPMLGVSESVPVPAAVITPPVLLIGAVISRVLGARPEVVITGAALDSVRFRPLTIGTLSTTIITSSQCARSAALRRSATWRMATS